MVRIEVPDATSARGLVQRLASVFEPTSILHDTDRGEVRVEEKQRSSRAITQILGTVEQWLEEAAVGSAVVWLDGTRYTLTAPNLSGTSKQWLP